MRVQKREREGERERSQRKIEIMKIHRHVNYCLLENFISPIVFFFLSFVVAVVARLHRSLFKPITVCIYACACLFQCVSSNRIVSRSVRFFFFNANFKWKYVTNMFKYLPVRKQMCTAVFRCCYFCRWFLFPYVFFIAIMLWCGWKWVTLIKLLLFCLIKCKRLIVVNCLFSFFLRFFSSLQFLFFYVNNWFQFNSDEIVN